MEPEIILFVLRLLSGLTLLILIGAILTILWQDFRIYIRNLDANQRSFGYLIKVQEIDNSFVPTGDVFTLLPITTIGRAPTNSITVDDEVVSANHALITRNNGQWWVEDRSSRNGTTLNGLPVNQSLVITHGDVIGTGNSYFQVDLET